MTGGMNSNLKGLPWRVRRLGISRAGALQIAIRRYGAHG